MADISVKSLLLEDLDVEETSGALGRQTVCY